MNRKKNSLNLIFALPICAFFLFELFFKEIDINRSFNVIENFLFASILIIISLFMNNLSVKQSYLKLTYLFFCICLLFESVYYYNFDTIFSPSAIFIIIETNMAEAKEFIWSYLNKGTLSLFVLFFIVLVIGYYMIKDYRTNNRLENVDKLKWGLLVCIILVFLKFSKLIVYNVPYLTIKSATEYYKETQRLKVYGNEHPIGNFTNVKRTQSIKDKEFYIIVIGESTSRSHFELCSDYYRETTPSLNQIKEELAICTNVISPHAFTVGSLTKGLTLGNYENPKGKYQGSIIQLLNQSGFKTYWISNQRPIGISDTQVTKIGRGANMSIFLNIKHTSENAPYDQVLVDELKKISCGEGDKKVVFLHMLGAHMDYKKRYPQNFNYFQQIPQTQFKRHSVYNTINAYDNVIRYNDYVLREIIETARKQKASSFVLYFSDHGQEVYDDINFHGQSVDRMVTKNMYEIPMFLWQSEAYKKINTIEKELERKYMTDDMFHTIADLCQVKSSETDSTRSIFNAGFRERKRIIKDYLEFDDYFKISNE